MWYSLLTLYLSPLSISFASEATLNARIDWRRPKLARCDDVNLDDSVTAPETEVGNQYLIVDL